MNKSKVIELYLDWVNNFLTVGRFASYYGLDVPTAKRVINIGRKACDIAYNRRKQQGRA